MGEIIPIEECRRVRLYSSIQAATRWRAAAWVANSSPERSSNSTVECQDSMTALSSADPGRPIDWRIWWRPQAARKEPGGVFAAAVGVQHHPAHLPSADGDRHG